MTAKLETSVKIPLMKRAAGTERKTVEVPLKVYRQILPDGTIAFEITNPYRLALQIQNACNASGMIHSLDRVVSILWNEARALEASGEGGGAEHVNKHPALRLFLHQLVYISMGVEPRHDYFEASQTCEAAASAIEEACKAAGIPA